MKSQLQFKEQGTHKTKIIYINIPVTGVSVSVLHHYLLLYFGYEYCFVPLNMLDSNHI